VTVDVANAWAVLREAAAEIAKRGGDRLIRRALAAQEFTAAFPLRATRDLEQDRALRQALARFAELTPSPLAAVPGLHSARFLLLDSLAPALDGTARNAGPAEPDATVSGPLVFAFICDGYVLDVLEEMIALAPPELEAIFAHCHRYPGASDRGACLHYLRSHRVRSAYMFRDTRQLDGEAAHLHPSAREIHRALELRRAFVRFVIAHRGPRPGQAQQAQLQRAFRAFRDGRWPTDGAAADRNPALELASGYPFTLSPDLERPLEHELQWVRRTAEIARARARRDARARKLRDGKLAPARRGAHAKHHGLLRARFCVARDLEPRLHHGLFVPGAEYDAYVRPSNSDARARSDLRPDARGLAIKLLDVGCAGALPALDPPLPDGMARRAGELTQDFALVSHPTFFVKDARDYAILRSLVEARPDRLGEALGVTASTVALMLQRLPELSIFARTLLRWARHPLAIEYHSLTPFLMGPEQAVKFSVRPSAASRELLDGRSLASSLRDCIERPHDYLELALQRSLDALDGGQLELEFSVHLPSEAPLPVEDARVDWDERGASRVVAATLTIAAQDATSAARKAMAEAMVVTPWHALAAHRPLGSLNRARLSTYVASAEERARANGWPDPLTPHAPAAAAAAVRPASTQDEPGRRNGVALEDANR
jgi:hypothetical protein